MPAPIPSQAEAAAEPGPFLRTKFQAPPMRSRGVARPRLLARLRDDSQPVALVAAPAGYGKTTLLSNWIVSDGRAAAWVTLDANDNVPRRFLAAVAASLDRLQPGIGRRTLVLLDAVPPVSPAAIAAGLINDLGAQLHADERGRPALLVLEEYHLITSPAVHEIAQMLIEHLPPLVRLVIATRTDPPLPLPGLRARNHLAEVRMADLAFTPEEAAAFLRRTMKLRIDAEAARALAARAEGWVAALQLAGLTLQQQADPAGFIATLRGAHRPILDYLIAEVLDQQPAPIRDFLLRTSVLGQMCGDLCEAILGEGQWAPDASAATPTQHPPSAVHAQEMLERLEAANLFVVALDGERRWFRYHQLFADALRHRLSSEYPGLELELCRRAAAWHERAGLLVEAVMYALEARDWERAAACIERGAEVQWSRSELGTVENWLQALPESMVRGRTRLAFIQAKAFSLQMRMPELELWLPDVERGLERDYEADPANPALLAMRAEALAMRGAVTMRLGRDPARALNLQHQALAIAPADDKALHAVIALDMGQVHQQIGDLDSAYRLYGETVALARQSRDPYLAFTGLTGQIEVQLEQARLSAAVEKIGEAEQLVDSLRAQGLPVTGLVRVYRGQLAYERNELSTALPALLRGMQLARQGGISQTLVAGLTTLARLRLARGEHARALGEIDVVEDAVNRANYLAGASVTAALRAAVWMARRQLVDLAHWADQTATALPPDPFPVSAALKLVAATLARAYMLLGRSDAALTLLDRMERPARSAGARSHLIDIAAIRALVLDRAGQSQAALDALSESLALAEPEGYVRVYLDAGEPMAAALQRMKDEGGRIRAYADRLLTAYAHERETLALYPSLLHPLIEPLTPREAELLRLIASGSSNREIAAHLSLTVNTIKSYTKSLYGKLGVERRTQAVARARELGLLP